MPISQSRTRFAHAVPSRQTEQITMKLRLCRLLPIVAACAVLSACGGNEPDTNDAQDETSIASAATSERVVIHMTGLVMIVPPKTGEKVARVLLPPLQQPAHAARLGFGIQATNPDAIALCTDSLMVRDHGICYVDLTQWNVDPLGTGGTAVPNTVELPHGVLHATRLAGGLHKVPAPNSNIPEVVFLSGWAGPTHCSLANWTVGLPGPQGETTETHALLNVLDWEIDGLTNPTMTFRRKNGAGAPITVPLVKAQNGRIELILANVPVTDLKHLPPGAPAGLEKQPPPRADHVQAYYGVLANQAGQGPERRPIPRDPRPTTTRPCPVAITAGPTATHQKARLVEAPAAIATYACIVATGE